MVTFKLRVFLTALLVFSCFKDGSVEASTNKESFSLQKEDFSSENDINYPAIYKHLNYSFKDPEYLKAALSPLLPRELQRPKKEYEHLEFLGDAVLGLVIRERILALFPNEERGIHNQLYTSLTQNKTLADIFVDRLKSLQRWLPYPNRASCKYCNVVEALIGAIFKDNNSEKALTYSRKFIMSIIDDHLLIQKWQEIPLDLKNSSSSTMILPKVNSIIEELDRMGKLNVGSPKSLLGEILSQAWGDHPQYEVCLGRDDDDHPAFVTTVSGAQIGRTIKGFGSTVNRSEAEAARRAINFLAQKELITTVEDQKSSYCKIVNEYFQNEGLEPPNGNHQNSLSSFKFQVRVGNEIIAEGSGHSKALAKEGAAQAACSHLLKDDPIDKTQKNYRTILNEGCIRKQITGLKFEEVSSSSSPFKFKFQVKEGAFFEGSGNSKEEAREDAYRLGFEQLLNQEKLSTIKSKSSTDTSTLGSMGNGITQESVKDISSSGSINSKIIEEKASSNFSKKETDTNCPNKKGKAKQASTIQTQDNKKNKNASKKKRWDTKQN